MTDIINLFGGSLLSKSGAEINANTALDGKYIGIYFSAHWCPPCRGFTPKLAKFYEDFKASSSVPFEIVFVSSDKDVESFNEYYASMPWLALPFAKRDEKAVFSRRFKVEGIPTLVIIDPSGNLVTSKGVEKVSRNPSGSDFPWTPKTLPQEVGDHFLSKSGTTTAASFAGKYLGIYFSAHWCPPCRNFTPKLVAYYNNRKAAGKNDFEIIFASADNSEAEFNEYYGTMPWLSFPLNDPRIEELNSRFNVEGIPTLVIMDSNWQIVTVAGVAAIMSNPSGDKFPHHPEPVVDISEGLDSYGFDVNSKASLIAFIENSDDQDQASAIAALYPSAVTLAKDKASGPDGPELLFFVATKPDRMSAQIRQMCRIGEAQHADNPVMVILDIPDNGGFYVSDATEITPATVTAFIAGFQSKSIERQQLRK